MSVLSSFPGGEACAGKSSIMVAFVCGDKYMCRYVFILQKAKSKKCGLHLEQKVVRLVMVFSSWGGSFHCLSLATKAVLSPHK